MFHRSNDDRQVWETFRGHSRTFSFAAMLLPASVRSHVANVYLLCRRIDTIADDLILDVGAERASDELDALESALFDTIGGEPPSGWIWWRIHRTHTAYPLRMEAIGELIDGARWDIAGRPISSRDDLIAYSALVGGTIGDIMLPFLVSPGTDPDELAPIARELGIAMQMTNILRDVGEDWRMRRRIYLPAVDLAEAGVDLPRLVADGRPDEAYIDLIEEYMADAEARYDAALPAVDALARRARPAIGAAVRMYREIMNEVRANAYDNLSQRAFVPFRRKAVVALFDRYEDRKRTLLRPIAVSR